MPIEGRSDCHVPGLVVCEEKRSEEGKDNGDHGVCGEEIFYPGSKNYGNPFTLGGRSQFMNTVHFDAKGKNSEVVSIRYLLPS